MNSKLLTPEDVAERLTVNAATVRAWLRKGSLKGIKIGRKVWRISEVELNAFLSCKDNYIYNTEQAEHSNYWKDSSSVVRENQSEVKELLIKDLDQLSVRNIEKIYDLATTLKEEEASVRNSDSLDAYMRVRQALSSFSGSLADDLLKERNDRL
jgi:excisionase family DNA binding protein